MNGSFWFGHLAADWHALPLKRLVTLGNKRIERPLSEVRYIGLENVESWTGRLTALDNSPIEEAAVSDSSNVVNCFGPGDVLFGKLRPYLAKAHLAMEVGVSTTELLVLKPGPKLHPRFLLYGLLSRNFIGLIDASTFGSKMPRADWEFIGSAPLPVPSLSEQRAIADYLDQETARIDALVAAKERVLGLLAEKRRALITRAVTRGLNQDAPMRDSGVAWLGEVPAHWQVERTRWLFRERDERGEPELPLLNVSLNTGVTEREFDEDRIERVASDYNDYKVARQGDIAFNKMRMWQGAVGVAPRDGLVSPDYTVAYPISEIVVHYFGLLFKTAQMGAEFARHSHGIVWDRLRLYWEGFQDIVLPLPPIDEQRTIVAHIQAETQKLDALQKMTKRTVGLLKERRAALIAAAVTGRVRVGAGKGGGHAD